MLKRTLSGLVIVIITAAVLYYSYIPAVSMSAAAILCCCCVWELAHATGALKNAIALIAAFLGSLVLCYFEFPGYLFLAGAALIVSIPYFAFLMKNQRRVQLHDTAAFLFLSIVAVVQLSALPRLRSIPNGVHYLIIVIAECFLTDVAAYLVGSRWGRRKLLPTVSPNKTILGSAAGLVTAVVFCLFYGMALQHFGAVHISFIRLLSYSVIANLLAQFGDLSMSVVKRITGIKDFSNLIPGHGGMLDRFDSHIFVLSFTYLFCRLTGGFIL